MIFTDGIHLVATDNRELHDFAAQIGLKRCWYRSHPVHPHYDLYSVDGRNRSDAFKRALLLGAKKVSSRDIVKFFQSINEPNPRTSKGARGKFKKTHRSVNKERPE
jgi:hypothetical protein